MRRLAFVLVCLACASHDHGVHASIHLQSVPYEENRRWPNVACARAHSATETHELKGRRSLADLLASLNAAAAFSPSAPGGTLLTKVDPPLMSNTALKKLPTRVSNIVASAMEKSDTPFLDRRLLRQFVNNQLLLGYPIWTGGFGAKLLAEQVHLDSPGLWLLGVLGSLPILAIGRAIETSEGPLFTELNLSTKMVVMRLFGSKFQPVLALGVSILLCALTGIVEEIIFRGGVLASIAGWAVDNNFAATLQEGEPLAVILSSLLFALGHVNLLGGSAIFTRDTLTLFGLQLTTGLTFAILYILTGQLTVPIIAHFLYDLYTLYETHIVLTDQISYSETVPLQQSVVGLKWKVFRGQNFVDEARRAFLLMDTNRDEVLSTSELRMGLSSMGLKLPETQLQSIFESADLDGSNDIDFDEFLEFVATAEIDGSAKAAKSSFLGVRG